MNSLMIDIEAFFDETKEDTEVYHRYQHYIRNKSKLERNLIGIKNPATGLFEDQIRYQDSIVNAYYNFYLGMPVTPVRDRDNRQHIKFIISASLNKIANEYWAIQFGAKKGLGASAVRTIPLTFAFTLLYTLNGANRVKAVSFLSEIYNKTTPTNPFTKGAHRLLIAYKAKTLNKFSYGDVYAYLAYCWENYVYDIYGEAQTYTAHRDIIKHYPIEIAKTKYAIGGTPHGKITDLKNYILRNETLPV